MFRSSNDGKALETFSLIFRLCLISPIVHLKEKVLLFYLFRKLIKHTKGYLNKNKEKLQLGKIVFSKEKGNE